MRQVCAAFGGSDLPYLLTADRCLVGFVSKNELLALSQKSHGGFVLRGGSVGSWPDRAHLRDSVSKERWARRSGFWAGVRRVRPLGPYEERTRRTFRQSRRERSGETAGLLVC